MVPPAAPGRRERRQARRARRKRQRHLLRLAAGAGSGCPGCGATCAPAAARSSISSPWPTPSATAPVDGVRPVDPALVRRPGLQLRLAVTALRAGVLRFVTEDGTIVESDARTPAPGAAAGPVDLVDGAIASASVPMVFPPRSMADDDYVDGGVIEIVPVRAAADLGATRIFAVVAVPLTLARDERDYAAAPAGYIGLRSMGMIGVAERQISNLNASLPEGVTLTTIDPVVDVVGLFEVQPGLLRINKDYGWLRAADVLAEGDAAIVADMVDGTHAIVEARREAWRLEESLWAARRGRERGRDARSGTRAEGAGPRARRPAQAARLPRPGRVRGLVERVRGPHEEPPGRPPGEPVDPPAATDSSLGAGLRRPAGRVAQTVGPPSQPRLRNTMTRTTAVTSSSPIPIT